MEQPKPNELEGNPPEQNNVEASNASHRDRSHYRSASWSFTPNNQTISDPSITNPALQIASVLRGFVPGISPQQQGSPRPNSTPVSNSIREMDTTIDMEPGRIGLGEAVSSVSSAQTSVSRMGSTRGRVRNFVGYQTSLASLGRDCPLGGSASPFVPL